VFVISAVYNEPKNVLLNDEKNCQLNPGMMVLARGPPGGILVIGSDWRCPCLSLALCEQRVFLRGGAAGQAL